MPECDARSVNVDMQESGIGVLVLSGYHNAGVTINLIVQLNALSMGCSDEGSRLYIIIALRLRVALMFTSRADFAGTSLAKSKDTGIVRWFASVLDVGSNPNLSSPLLVYIDTVW